MAGWRRQHREAAGGRDRVWRREGFGGGSVRRSAGATGGRRLSGDRTRVEAPDHQIVWTKDFLKKSKCSSASPVPRATQSSEFSAT